MKEKMSSNEAVEILRDKQQNHLDYTDIISTNAYREYEIKVYLNARHYIFIGGNRGEDHPHTWEFTLQMLFPRDFFIEFGTIEKQVNEYLSKYQGHTLNEYEPFSYIIPTLENIADYFGNDMFYIIRDLGGILYRVKAKETPTRTYAADISGVLKNKEDMNSLYQNIMNKLINNKLDDILKK
jgi:6-pyruvoyltetrahydropterin/6-carboxytetrahydropterin synthase